MQEIVDNQVLPAMLRRYFCIIITTNPLSALVLWQYFKTDLLDEPNSRHPGPKFQQEMHALVHIEELLQRRGAKLQELGLPTPE